MEDTLHEVFILVRTDPGELRTHLLESEEPITDEQFATAARQLTPGSRLEHVRQTTEVLISAVGVDAE